MKPTAKLPFCTSFQRKHANYLQVKSVTENTRLEGKGKQLVKKCISRVRTMSAMDPLLDAIEDPFL